MTVRRWKFLSALLALSTAFFAYRGHAGNRDSDAAAEVDRGAIPTSNALARRQLRIPAAALGLNEATIIRQLKATSSANEATMLCEKLGFIGTDDAVEALTELADDRRPGVSNAALQAIGHIGTSRATRFLLGLEETGTHRQRAEVIAALGQTNADSARERLLEIIGDTGEAHRPSAAYALGELGGDDVVQHLEALAVEVTDQSLIGAIVYSLSRIGTTAANDALIALSKSSNRALRRMAIARLGGTSENHGALLAALSSDDPQSVAAAAQALGQSRSTDAVPRLITLATSGGATVRNAAISALGQIGGDEATDNLATLLGARDGSGYSVAAALAAIGTDQARAVLIDAAMTNSGDRNSVISAMRSLRGPDIDAAMLAIAETGRVNERFSALNHLINVGAPGAVELAAKMAMSGQPYQRQNTVRLLGQAGSEDAREALRRIASTDTGQVRVAALEALADLGDKTASAETFAEMLSGGSGNEAAAAARALANLGTPESKDALLAALSGDDAAAQSAASMVINQLGNDEATREVLVAAAEKNPAIREQILRKLLATGASEGIDMARDAIEGDDASKATSAVYALGNGAGDEIGALLATAASSSNAQVRASAAGVFAQRGDPDATEALTRLAADSEASVRNSALHSLGRVGTTEAIDALIDASNTSDKNDRAAAASALGSSGDPRANERIVDLLRDGDDTVAVAAVWASGNGDRRTESALRSMLGDASRSDMVRQAVANQLRNRGARLSDSEKAMVEKLAGGYGNRYLH